jgi:hypothetical protein
MGAGPSKRDWRRLAVAGPISLLLHLLLLVLARPEYLPVSDFAVELEVVEVTPGEPGSPAEQPAPPVEPEQPPEVPDEAEEPEPTPDPTLEPDVAAGQPFEALADAGIGLAEAGDAGPGGAGDDAGTGEGSGICLHDLFPYGQDDPSWLLWLSMASFRGTAYQEDLGRTLGSFDLYRKMTGATGLDPRNEVEGLLVTADDAFDWRTFRVVATYDSGEEPLRGHLAANRGDRPGFHWEHTAGGYEAALPGSFRWHLVGSGRVLAVTHEPKGPPQSPLPPNPYEDDSSPTKDAGTKPKLVAPDAGIAYDEAGEPIDDRADLPRPSFPEWPRQVTCMTQQAGAITAGAKSPLTDLARAHLGPDPDGHWPVAMLATRDPRAVGLGSSTDLPVRFRYAVAYAFFSEPVRIEGRVRFHGRTEEVAEIATMWRRMIEGASADPFLRIAGLGGVFEGLELEAQGAEIRFELPLTRSQIQAALLFIQLQGEALERRTFQKKRAKPSSQSTPLKK